MFAIGPAFWTGAAAPAPPPSPLPLTFDFSGYGGVSASPPQDMTWVEIPAGMISDYAALGLTVPTLPDQFGELSSKLTNEHYDGTGTPSFYWVPINAPVSGSRLVYYKLVEAGTLEVEFLVDAALGAKTMQVLTTASGDDPSLRATFSDGTTSTQSPYLDSPLTAEGTITFTATGVRVITKLTVAWPSGSTAGMSISRIILDN